ncbi:MAG: hypothetical protein ACRD3J_04325 [Thermoanaerobaculia bacterium]
MTFAKKPFALACVAVASVTLSAFAQTSQLNPTVKVLSRPQSPVPAECATDIDTTAPALEPESQPAPSTESVPPSNSLRASLRRVQVAAEGDDYAAFKAALAEARRMAASHPAGGERNAANDAIQVYTDIARVWDYAMASPSGSFFDGTVQGGSLLAALKRYPDYGKTIASETIVAGGRTLYPSRETRRFLARESSRRLARLGVSVPAKMAGPKPEWPRIAPPPAPPVVKKPVQVTTKTKPATPKTTASVTSKPARHKPPAKTAATTPVPKAKPPVKIATTTAGTAGVPPASTSTHEAKPPASPKPPVTTTSSPAPTTTPESTAGGTPALPGTSVVSTQPPPTTTTATATTPATETTASTSTAPATDTTDTATTGTTAPAEKHGNTNIIWAIVLILVGIGVLVILFRASD